MIAAVIFDLDETLLDRTTSLTSFLADQYLRFRYVLGDITFETWSQRFLALDARGSMHKSIVYPASAFRVGLLICWLRLLSQVLCDDRPSPFAR
jgi:putative hydrolase of the HAD superfamily